MHTEGRPVCGLVLLCLGLLADGCQRDYATAPPVPIDDVALEGDRVVALDINDEPLFQRQYEGPENKALLADLDGDGVDDLVVGSEFKGGLITALRPDGTTAWERAAYKPPIYAGGSSGRSKVIDLTVHDLLPQDGSEVIALLGDPNWYASRVVIVNGLTGVEIAEYWNPGQLGRVAVVDLEHDGAWEILISNSSNNDMRSILYGVEGHGDSLILVPLADGTETNYLSLFLLGAGDVSGQAPPYLGGDAGQGSHRWYGIFEPQGVAISQMSVVDVDGDGVDEISLSLTNGVFFDIAPNGRVLRRGRGDNVDPSTVSRTNFRLVGDCFWGTLGDGSQLYTCLVQ